MPPRYLNFTPGREPHRDNEALHLFGARTKGPVSFLNPTRAQFHHSKFASAPAVNHANGAASTSVSDEEKADEPSKDETTAPRVSFLWRSRDNRKGRHALAVPNPQSSKDDKYIVPGHTTQARQIGKGILRMFTTFPYWDISWWVAFIFTLGSVVWVFNGFFVWLPTLDPSTEFPTEILYGGGITAFLGAIVFFETGSILLFFEAVNENNSGCFGWALEQLVEGDADAKGSRIRIRPEKHACSHHHQNRTNFVGTSSKDTHPDSKPRDEATKDGKTWQWFPSWHSLRTHYLHELGFLAGMAQLFGATIFGISGFTALPGIQDHLTEQRVLNGVYWIPQVVGGSGFIVSGTLYMLETQKNFYTPALGVLGWWIGFWNWIGALGFTLSGALGPAYGNSGAQYQAGCATFWGSWAFLIGSLLQLYESLDKYPVVEDRGKESWWRPG